MIDLNIEAPMRCRAADGTWIALAARLQETAGRPTPHHTMPGTVNLSGWLSRMQAICSAHWDLLVV
jgi:hypothetical protein